MKMKNILLYIWQLPQNIVGLAVIFLYGAIKGKCNYKDSALWFVTKFGGVSLGRYIIIHANHASNTSTIKHEYGHSIQSKILGPLYLFIIGIPSGIHNLLHQIGIAKGDYYKYWCEKWADRLGGVERK